MTQEEKEKELATQIKNLTELLAAKFSSATPKEKEAELTAMVDKVHAMEKQIEAIQRAKAVQKMVFGTIGTKTADDEKLLGFGAFLKGVATKDTDVLNAVAKAAGGQSIGVNADGGYAVPVEYSTELIKLLRLFGIARQVARLVPMSSLTRKVNSQLTNPTATYTDEAVDHTLTKITLDTPITQTAKKLSAVVPITEEVLAENNIGMDQVIYEAVAQAFAVVEDTQAFSGNGSPFTGILNASGIVTATQNGATPSYDDLVDTMMGIAASYRMNGTWVIDSAALKLIMKVKDDNGVPIWTSPIGGNPGTILGKPYRETEAFTSKLIFGDFRYLWLSDRSSYEVKTSTEATYSDDESAFMKDEVLFKFRQRHSINVMKGSAFATMTLASA